MRKITSTILAALCLTACIQETIIVEAPQQSQEITFSNSFEAFVTRAQVLDGNTLEGFNVWGFYKDPIYVGEDKGATAIFEGTQVSKNATTGLWDYEGDTRYWIPDRTYYFAGIAPILGSDKISVTTGTDMESSSAISEITFTNFGTDDLIYGVPDAPITVSNTSDFSSTVGLKFEHLLSKVKVSFENKVDKYINVSIDNLTIKALGESIYTVASQSWNLANDGKTDKMSDYAFNSQLYENVTINDALGNPVEQVHKKENIGYEHTGFTESLFFIPANKYQITFDVIFKMDKVEEVLYHKTVSSTLSLSADKGLQKGCAYNFKTTLTLDVVQNGLASFEIEHLKNWDEDKAGQEYWTDFTDLSKILFASKFGGEVTLSDAVSSNEYIDVVDDLTINLNGKTLTFDDSSNTNKSTYLFNVYNNGRTTNNADYNISTLTINGEAEGSSIISNSSACIATAGDGGEIIVNGGNHTTSGSTLYKANGGNIYINKGKFASSNGLQMFAADGGRVIVDGGSFFMWNPENYKVENAPVYYNAQDDDVVMHDRNDWFHIKKYVLIDNEKSAENKNELNDALADGNVGKVDLTGPYSYNAGSSTSDPNQEFGYKITNDIEIDFGNIKSTVNAGRYAFRIDNASVTINNMNLESSDCIAILSNSYVVFNGSKINFKGTNSGGRYCFYVVNSQLEINGGEFNNVGSRSSDRYMWAAGTAQVKINGGTWGFANKTTPSPPMYVDTNATLEITGGTFNFNPDSITYASGSLGTILITGGTFTSSTKPTKHNAPGYEYVSSGTNKWTVQAITPQ